MHIFTSTVGVSESFKVTKVLSAPSGSKKELPKSVSEAWLAFDAESEQQVQVEQTYTVSRPLVGPFETLLLAGLIATVLVRHVGRCKDNTLLARSPQKTTSR